MTNLRTKLVVLTKQQTNHPTYWKQYPFTSGRVIKRTQKYFQLRFIIFLCSEQKHLKKVFTQQNILKDIFSVTDKF